MNKKHARILALSLYTLLCTDALHAEVLKTISERTTLQLGAATGNLLTEQSYLDHYTVDKGNAPLTHYDLTSTYKLLNQHHNALQLELYQINYPDIHTYTLGTNLVYRVKPHDSYWHGYFAGYDYTHYDQLEFMQASLGYELHIYDLDANLALTLPFNNGQQYYGVATTAGAIDSELLAMNGFEINALKGLHHLNFMFNASYHWNHQTKQPFVGTSVGADYDLGLGKIGIMQQYRNGLDSEQWGTRVFAKLSLLKDKPKHHHKRQMTSPVQRQRGVVLSAKERDCPAGLTSYSANGVTTCSTSNPFDSALIQPSSLKSGTTMSKTQRLMKQSQLVKSTKPIVFSAGIHQICTPLFYDAPYIAIQPGAILSFCGEGAMLVGPNTPLKIGGTQNSDLPVVIQSASLFRHHVEQTVSRRRAGLLNALRRVQSSSDITASLDDKRFPSIGLVVLGHDRLDIDSPNLIAHSSVGEILELDRVSAGSDSMNAQLSISLNQELEEDVQYNTGGNNNTLSPNEIHKTVVSGVPLRFIATNTVIDDLQILPANGAAISQIGGQLVASNYLCQATTNTSACLTASAGAQVFLRDAILDLSYASQNTSAVRIRNYGKATDLANMTSLIVEDSLFKGVKSDSGLATKFFLDLPEKTTSSKADGSGYSVGILNSTMMSQGTPATITDPTTATASITSLGPTGAGQAFVSSNTDIASPKAQFLGYFGNTYLIDTSGFDLDNATKKDAMTRELSGLGNIFTTAGNGSVTPFSLGGDSTSFSQLGSRIDAQSFTNTLPWSGAIAAGKWNGDNSDDADVQDTSKLMRYLDNTSATTSTGSGPMEGDPITLPANSGASTSAIRAKLVSTKALSTSGSVSWSARTRDTNDTNVLFGGTGSKISKIRSSQMASDVTLASFVTDYINGNDLSSYAAHTNAYPSASTSQLKK